MSTTKTLRLQTLLFSVLVMPVILCVFSYFGFRTNYTTNVFTRAGVEAQYSKNVYRYRIVGPRILLALDQALDSRLGRSFTSRLPVPVSTADPISPSIYCSYFIENTAGIVLALLFLSMIFEQLGVSGPSLLILLCGGAMAITQYVITPYDGIAYALLCLGMLCSVRDPDRKGLWLLIGVVAVGALNRETAALNIAFEATLAVLLRKQFQARLLRTGVLLAAFGIPYIGLRLALGFQQGVIQQVIHQDISGFTPWIGLLFLVAGIRLVTLYTRKSKWFLPFLVFSLPYSAVILIGGIWFECRLYVPLFLCGLVLSLVEATWDRESGSDRQSDVSKAYVSFR